MNEENRTCWPRPPTAGQGVMRHLSNCGQHPAWALRNTLVLGLVADDATDLLSPIPWGDGQTILREALLVADHNAYHLGQLVAVRRMLGAWAD